MGHEEPDAHRGRPDPQGSAARFETAVLPHLDAAYNLARWLMRRSHDAEDIVQEATLRALRSFDGFRGGDARSWLLTIVRNTCYSRMRAERGGETPAEPEQLQAITSTAPAPPAVLERQMDGESLREAIDQLPIDFREALVLREMEGMSYKQIADVTGVAVGTVMSRLSRARGRLKAILLAAPDGGGSR